jgi:hypothetical protein
VACRPAAFADLVKADRDRVRYRNSHFTSGSLISFQTGPRLLLGTTLGDVCTMDTACLATVQPKQFASVVRSCSHGHEGGTNSVCTIKEGGPESKEWNALH